MRLQTVVFIHFPTTLYYSVSMVQSSPAVFLNTAISYMKDMPDSCATIDSHARLFGSVLELNSSITFRTFSGVLGKDMVNGFFMDMGDSSGCLCWNKIRHLDIF
jgi:hypothetical protein